MTNLTCEFTDINGKLAIKIKAINASTGDKILLDDILEGRYGTPSNISGKTKAGQASELILAFESGAFATGGLNFNTLSIVPEWKTNDVIFGKVESILADDDREYFGGNLEEPYTSDPGYYFLPSRRQKLYFNTSDFEAIKDFQPHVLVARYAPSKTRGFRKNKSKAGFKTLPNRINRIPLTEAKTEINFEQEKYFRSGKDYIKSRNLKNNGDRSASAIFQFRIELTIEGKKIITNPLLDLRLQASVHKNSSVNGNLWLNPEDEHAKYFVAISYKMR